MKRSRSSVRWMPALVLFFSVTAFTGRADPAAIARQPGYMKGELIYPLDDKPTPECHASTLAETRSGIVAAWFGGQHEKNRDVGIWFARLGQAGWSRPIEVVDGVQHRDKRYPCWNPVLYQVPEGLLLLFYKVGPTPSGWWGMLTVSNDAGRTWSPPLRLPEDVVGPVKNKPVRLPNGDLLCGTSTEHDGWRVHFERTPDLGLTWSLTRPVNDGRTIGAIQPSILFHPGGKLQALGRTRQGRIFEIWSDDRGKTWGEMTLADLPNPNSGTDAVTLKDGRHLLVYNHTRRGRTPLNVAVSTDGKQWQAALVLEDQPGEYSYPAVIQAEDGTVGITYTYRRLSVKYVAVNPTELSLKPIHDGRWPE